MHVKKVKDNSKVSNGLIRFPNENQVLDDGLPTVQGRKKMSENAEKVPIRPSDENASEEYRQLSRSGLPLSPLSVATYRRRQSMMRVQKHYANLNLADYEKAVYSCSSIHSSSSDAEVDKNKKQVVKTAGVKLDSITTHGHFQNMENKPNLNSKVSSSDTGSKCEIPAQSQIVVGKNGSRSRRNERFSLPTMPKSEKGKEGLSRSSLGHPFPKFNKESTCDDIRQHTALVREKGRERRKLKPIENR